MSITMKKVMMTAPIPNFFNMPQIFLYRGLEGIIFLFVTLLAHHIDVK